MKLNVKTDLICFTVSPKLQVHVLELGSILGAKCVDAQGKSSCNDMLKNCKTLFFVLSHSLLCDFEYIVQNLYQILVQKVQ